MCQKAAILCGLVDEREVANACSHLAYQPQVTNRVRKLAREQRATNPQYTTFLTGPERSSVSHFCGLYERPRFDTGHCQVGATIARLWAALEILGRVQRGD